MQIQSVSLNKYTNTKLNNNLKANNKPSFKGELTNDEYYRVLDRLKRVEGEIIQANSFDKLLSTMDALVAKYESMGVRSAAVQVISKEDTEYFLGDKASEYDLSDKVLLCIAVGNRNNSVENMTNIYETATLIMPEKILSDR